MHRLITCYTQSTVCQSGFYERISSNKLLSSSPGAHSRFSKGGQLFGGLGELHDEAACDACRSQAFARGDRGHASPRKKIEWCNLIRFGAYFHNFFTLKKSKNMYFLYKNNDKL